MRNILKITTSIVIGCCLFSCADHQGPRRPLSHSEGSFLTESVERNKKLVAGEEAKIDSIIKSHPEIKYTSSNKGYWYYYQNQDSISKVTPVRGDVVNYTYEIQDLKGNVIYSEVQLQPQVYHIDKENIIMGLRHGIKLMKVNEKVTFLFPSHMAYGYLGDNKRIGRNEPLLYTVTLNKIEKSPTN